MKNHPQVVVEIVAKKKGCMLCDLAEAALEELAENLKQGLLTWGIVDVSAREGLERYRQLSQICGRKPAVPSIIINQAIAFDNIPHMDALWEAVQRALEV